MMKDINRIKVVLVEKKRTSKWLSELQLGVGKFDAEVSEQGLLLVSIEFESQILELKS